MFDFGDTSDYSEEARRELFRAAFDNIEFFLNSVFKLDTSPQQTTMFKYLVQAMTASPNATLSDMQP